MGYYSGRDPLREIGLSFGLVGFTMIMLQPLLSARFRWIEHPFGLDRLLSFHRITGLIAAVFLILHPVILAISIGSSRLLLSMDLPWPLIVAKVTLLLALLFSLTALFRRAFKLPFQIWLRAHSALTLLILTGVFVHSYQIAIRFQALPIRILWAAFLVTGVSSYLYLNLFQRLGSRLNPLTVSRVSRETDNVWNLNLVPQEGRSIFRYNPGQFIFVTLLRRHGHSREEHPFTISSSPADRSCLSITAKESGDFTSTLGSTKPGDRAAVMGPFGRFSYTLLPSCDKYVFIAGGIGITPLMSMLRDMYLLEIKKDILLIYGNRTENDIVFSAELREISESGSSPDLRIIHLLSRPEPSWTGEKGHLDIDRLRKYVGDVSGKSFYVCGPPLMMNSAESILRQMGVRGSDIHMEKFSL